MKSIKSPFLFLHLPHFHLILNMLIIHISSRRWRQTHATHKQQIYKKKIDSYKKEGKIKYQGTRSTKAVLCRSTKAKKIKVQVRSQASREEQMCWIINTIRHHPQIKCFTDWMHLITTIHTKIIMKWYIHTGWLHAISYHTSIFLDILL